MSYANNLDKIKSLYYWHKIVFLTFFLIFSSLISSLSFAIENQESTVLDKKESKGYLTQSSDEEKKGLSNQIVTNEQNTQKDEIIVYKFEDPIKTNAHNSTSYLEQFEKGLSLLTEKGYNVTVLTIHYALERLSNEEKHEIAEMFSEQDTGKYAAKYIDAYRPLVITEVAKKTISRGARAYIFVGNLAGAYALTDSGIFVKRAFIELIRNFSPVVKEATANGDYLKAGRIIRTSLIAHFFVLPLQIAAGFATGPIFMQFAETPQTVQNCKYVDFYSKWSLVGAPFTEFSGITGEDLLAFQLPEQQLSYSIFNGLPLALYLLSGYLLQYLQIPQNEYLALGIYITSEFAVNSVNTYRLYNILANNEKYAKYQIFNSSNGPTVDRDALSSLYYTYSTFKTTFATTSTGVAQRLINLLYGNDAIRIGGTLDKISLVVNPFVVSGAKDSKKMLTDAKANKATDTEIKQIMYNGLGINSAISALYLIPVIAPGLVANNLDAITSTLVRISGIGNFIEGIERVANEEQSVFKKDEQSWLKTFGDYTKYVSCGFLAFFKFFPQQRNGQNYLIYRTVTILPPLLNIASVISYIWEINTNQEG